jgi:hypothetical protein
VKGTKKMPKFIGRTIPGCQNLPDNFDNFESGSQTGMVRISYSQARLLPPDVVFASLDTTDKGGRRSYAKRWNRWFAKPESILSCEKSTKNMRKSAHVVQILVESTRQ